MESWVQLDGEVHHELERLDWVLSRVSLARIVEYRCIKKVGRTTGRVTRYESRGGGDNGPLKVESESGGGVEMWNSASDFKMPSVSLRAGDGGGAAKVSREEK